MSTVNFKDVLAPVTAGELTTPQNSIWLVYAAVIIESVASAKHITEL
jgi:hypothetical protein